MKTHCKHGHEYTEANTITTSQGYICRECHNARVLARYHKTKTLKGADGHCAEGHPMTGSNVIQRVTGPACRQCAVKWAREALNARRAKAAAKQAKRAAIMARARKRKG